MSKHCGYSVDWYTSLWDNLESVLWCFVLLIKVRAVNVTSIYLWCQRDNFDWVIEPIQMLQF